MKFNKEKIRKKYLKGVKLKDIAKQYNTSIANVYYACRDLSTERKESNTLKRNENIIAMFKSGITAEKIAIKTNLCKEHVKRIYKKYLKSLLPKEPELPVGTVVKQDNLVIDSTPTPTETNESDYVELPEEVTESFKSLFKQLVKEAIAEYAVEKRTKTI